MSQESIRNCLRLAERLHELLPESATLGRVGLTTDEVRRWASKVPRKPSIPRAPETQKRQVRKKRDMTAPARLDKNKEMVLFDFSLGASRDQLGEKYKVAPNQIGIALRRWGMLPTRCYDAADVINNRREEVTEWILDGVTYQTIAERLGVSRTSVARVAAKWGVIRLRGKAGIRT